jgi:non-heme chloroperoxidase
LAPFLPSVEIRGATLAYMEQGRGAPLLFVHGSLDDLRSWRLQMSPFGKHYRVLAYSRRYHYPNAWTGDGLDYSAALHAEDLAALIEWLGQGPVHLVTSSYGGYVALYLGVRRPELVRTLVLGEPPLMPWLLSMPEGIPLAEAFDRDAWQPARGAFAAGDLRGGGRAFLDGVMGRPTFDILPPGNQALILDNAPEMRAEALSPGYWAPFTRDDATHLHLPVLLLTAQWSPPLFHLITGELERYLPNAVRAAIPRAFHAMHLGNPQVYNDTVLSFLAKH